MEAALPAAETSKRKPIPFRERITCSVADATEATSLSRSRLYELMNDGSIEYRMQGTRRLIVVASLLAALGIPA
jgi:hypothetical protein